jgi:hypothetical protein
MLVRVEIINDIPAARPLNAEGAERGRRFRAELSELRDHMHARWPQRWIADRAEWELSRSAFRLLVDAEHARTWKSRDAKVSKAREILGLTVPAKAEGSLF